MTWLGRARAYRTCFRIFWSVVMPASQWMGHTSNTSRKLVVLTLKYMVFCYVYIFLCLFHWVANFSFEAPSTHTYFLTCVFTSCHQNIGRPRANTKKLGRLFIYTPLRRCQCIGRRICPRKVQTSLRTHLRRRYGGPTEIDRSVFTWRSYSRYVTTCQTWTWTSWLPLFGTRLFCGIKEMKITKIELKKRRCGLLFLRGW